MKNLLSNEQSENTRDVALNWRIVTNGLHKTDKCLANFKDGNSKLIYVGNVLEFEKDNDYINSIDITYLNMNVVNIANLATGKYSRKGNYKVEEAESLEILHSNGTRDILTKGMATDIVIENDKIIEVTVVKCNITDDEINILDKIKEDISDQFQFNKISTQ